MNKIKELIPYLIIIIVVVLIRSFVVTPVRVDGSSMYPTLKNGEILILKKFDKTYDRFDVVVVKYNGERLVKRIIGLPGEHIVYKDSKLYVNDELIDEKFLPSDLTFDDFDNILLGKNFIPEDYYCVVGDNRNNSTDSRIIGFIPKNDILGVTNFRLFPFNKIGTFN